MLQHEQSASEDTLSSAKVHVTPEELARAIASIEAKKAHETNISTGTVTLGEAVESLCLDTTPDELLTEIKRQRSEEKTQEDEPQPVIKLIDLPRTRFPSEAEVFRPLFIAMTVIVCGFLGLSTFFPALLQYDAGSQWSAQTVSIPPKPTFSNQGILVTDVTSQGPVTLPLSLVPDNYPVFCPYDRASTLLPGYLEDSFSNHGNNVWRIIKHHGEVYLQGWVRNRRSLVSLETTAFNLANKPGAEGLGPHPVMLSLPLGQFHSNMVVVCTSDDGNNTTGYEKIRVSDARPDDYVWEAH